MYTVSRILTVVSVWTLVAALVSAQLTFSRDWSGGKRSAPAVFDCTQFTRLCRHLLHDLKQAMMASHNGKHHPRGTNDMDDLDGVAAYDDD